MDTFVRVGDHSPHIGISDLTPQLCQTIGALTLHTHIPTDVPRDVRNLFKDALKEAKAKRVAILPELRHVGPVEPERFFPWLTLQDVAHNPAHPRQIEIPTKYALDGVNTWKHRTLVQHLFKDRLYQSSDCDLADPRRILVLTLGRAGDIVGSAFTPNHDRPFLLALYAATFQLEAEMHTQHPRFVAHILGTGGVNRHRIRMYTSALAFLKGHIENLLRVNVA